jgi:C_GCAxxG_C_C family probable redox protein
MGRKDDLGTAKNEIASRAVSLFVDTDYNCAESVLLAAAERLRKCTPSIPCIATAFGGGMGRKGSVCGALTGAFMALGLVYGRSKPTDDREKIYGLARELYDRFTEKFGSPLCSELIACDLSTADGRDKYHKLNVRELKCKNYVSFCGETVAEMVGREMSKSQT